RSRILSAAAERVVSGGVAGVSMQSVADAAGVSKGLVHYHFDDRETLLAAVVGHLADEVVERERRALRGVSAAGAVDALWFWLDAELARGEIRALVELASAPEPRVREAARHAHARRCAAATETVEALFAALALRPRVPPSMLAEVSVAFTDGLAVRATHEAREKQQRAFNPRVAFDVFWLAMLGLAE
ncbi:MAG TPA: TetR/AcrR family transcriptional regulator, partial [Gemmatimonadaceae bacterium]|nr:TetR/AcrR family transcriptional regulator [Gemmatimonadaceae bacterium]